MARTGKIARLPREIRDELNRRLQNGEQGSSALAWLNDLPQVGAILARDFRNYAISKQNLCEWRVGGFKEWLERQEILAQARELAANADEIMATTGGRLTDVLATSLTVRYASLLSDWNGEATESFCKKLHTLRGLCQNIVELRRGDHSSARLKMEQERQMREQIEEKFLTHFHQSKSPAEPSSATNSVSLESNLVKPSQTKN